MSYYIARMLRMPFADAVAHATEALKREGFGIITQIDVSETLKQKLGVDYPSYRILGACNPKLAYEALQMENKVGTMLPCNVVVRDAGNGNIEVAAIDPVASMQAVNNPHLGSIAGDVRELLKQVVAGL